MSSANQAFFFGTGSGQLGLSLLRVGVTDGLQEPGDCTSVSTSCAGVYTADIKAVVANGGRVYASPWSPPAIYETNGNTVCNAGGGNGSLATSNYGSYATWLANFAQSLKTEDGVTLYAISVQNEPDQCQSYDSAVWSSSAIDTFIANNLGPTFSSAGLSTLIFAPEASNYSASNNLGAACGNDPSCTQYVGGFNWHEYQASLSGTNTVSADPYPSSWPGGKKYWETEASCGSGFGPNFCPGGFNTDITNALDWAALIDQRIAGDGANAWLYWQMIGYDGGTTNDDQSLMSNPASGSVVAKRAYALAQYSKFVRPGYFRIDATHNPQTGVSVSAYQNTSTNTLVIIATNYTGSPVSQTFDLTNAPTISSLTPTTTSASSNLAAQSSVSLSSNSFTYTLPAQSITTFASGSSTSTGPPSPSNLTGKVVQ
jgi:glucuronoarabinoxylan endo-1,4-beta-xylanase